MSHINHSPSDIDESNSTIITTPAGVVNINDINHPINPINSQNVSSVPIISSAGIANITRTASERIVNRKLSSTKSVLSPPGYTKPYKSITSAPKNNNSAFPSKSKKNKKNRNDDENVSLSEGYKIDDLLMALTLSMSLKESTKEEVGQMFIDHLFHCRYSAAISVYNKSSDQNKEHIRTIVSEIPWRISCEYLYRKDKLEWINSWAKIGWCSDSECETAVNYNNGRWISTDNYLYKHAIPYTEFRSVVWEGKGGDIILKILISQPRINVEFKYHSGYNNFLVPIKVGFIGNPYNIVDLAHVEIGSIFPLPSGNIDTARIPCYVVINADGTSYSFYQGVVHGDAFLPCGSYGEMQDFNIDNFDFNDSDCDNFTAEDFSSDEHDEYAE